MTPRRRTDRCPDCDAAPGDPHLAGCDVSRCMATGLQRLGHGTCGCDEDIWTGEWPGEAECREFGWLFGPDLPDLIRLYTYATWDLSRKRWVRTDAPPAESPHITLGKDA